MKAWFGLPRGFFRVACEPEDEEKHAMWAYRFPNRNYIEWVVDSAAPDAYAVYVERANKVGPRRLVDENVWLPKRRAMRIFTRARLEQGEQDDE